LKEVSEMNRATVERRLSVPSTFLVVAALAWTAGWVRGQDRGALEQKLSSQYKLAGVAGDRTAVLTAGTELVLQKDNLQMYVSSCGTSPLNTYSKGKLAQGFGGNFKRGILGTMRMSEGATTAECPQRRFVRGTKLWVTKTDVKNDGIVFTLYCTPDDTSIYYADVKFPFDKNAFPKVGEALATIGEVLTIQPDDPQTKATAPQQQQQQQQQPPAAPIPAPPAPEAAPAAIPPPPPPPAEAAPAPIAPPPPPAPDPVTVELGQTPQQVEAALGKPETILKPAVGTIRYVYAAKGIKVTFKNGKVSDIQ
jgi:hypothetical protein